VVLGWWVLVLVLGWWVGWLSFLPLVVYLVGGFSPTPLKDMRVRQIGSSPQIGGENKKYLSCHHQVLYPPSYFN